NAACGAIGDRRRNNVVLGDHAHENGISALGLKPAVRDDQGKMKKLNDVGTLIGVGYSEDDSATMRCYNVMDPDTMSRLVRRIDDVRHGPSTAPAVVEPTPDRDLLADVAAVLGTEPVPAADVAGALQTLAPAHRPYQQLSKSGLAKQLGELGVRVPSTGNRYPIDPDTVAAVLGARASEDTDDAD